MAGSAKRGTGIFEDCNRGGQEFDRRLYRIAMYDLQRHKGRPALRDEEQNPKVIERTDHKQINHMIMLYCKFNRRAVYIGIAVRQIRRI